MSWSTSPCRALTLRLLLACVTFGIASTSRADDWPQWLGPQRDGVWRETGILTKFPVGGPKVRWRVPVGQGYAGPAVADGKVFVTDRLLADGANNPKNSFSKEIVPGKERVVCLDEQSGKQIWVLEYDCPYKVSYAAGPRTTPVVHGGKVYTLGTMGDLLCLDEATGKLLWSKNFVTDYKVDVPLWGWSAHPLVDGDKLICVVGGMDSVAVAFNKDSGKEIWRALSANEPGYCPPVIIKAGGVRQLIIWDPKAVNSLNPETGAVYWSIPFEIRAGMSIPTPKLVGDHLFLSCFYNGSMMLKLAKDAPKAEVVWKGKSQSEQPRLTDGLHTVMSTPVFVGDYVYGVCSYGQVRCLKAENGDRLWETLKPTGGKLERWGNVFFVANGERYFLFNEQGDLIISTLTPEGYTEIDRAHILEPTNTMAGRPVVWVHPAFADKAMFVRNDKEIVSVSLAE